MAGEMIAKFLSLLSEICERPRGRGLTDTFFKNFKIMVDAKRKI